MKKGIVILWALCVMVSCATGEKSNGKGSRGGMSLEKAITESSDFFISRLPERRVIAILGIETPTKACSDFVHQELWNKFQMSGKFRIAEQQNIQRIQNQIEFQLDGHVSEDSAVKLGYASGAQTIIYGKLVKQGAQYRLTLYSTDIEKQESEIQSNPLNAKDPDLIDLLEAGDLDSRIESAITEMAVRLDQRRLVGIDRISYLNRGSVTDVSRYLENQVRSSAVRLYTRYAVADEKTSREYADKINQDPAWVDDSQNRIFAMVRGNYFPTSKNDAEVTLSLVSTDRVREQLGTCKFIVTQEELKKLNLSLLPDNYDSFEAYDTVQRKLAEFDTEHNKFKFSAVPDRPTAQYRDGDYMTFKLYSEKDCWFLVQFLQVDGVVKDMYPTEESENNYIRAGETRMLPDRGRIKLGKPYGEEYVLISAFTEQIAITNESVQLPKANFKTRGAEKEEYIGTVSYNRGIEPVARTKFSYTVYK